MRATLAALVLATAAPVAAVPVLLPQPRSLTERAGFFAVDAATPVVAAAGDMEAQRAAGTFTGLLARARGLSLVVTASTARPAIKFHIVPAGPAEAYRLEVAPGGADVTASTEAGLVHGGVTLLQLLTQTPGRGPARAGAVVVDDAPRFAWRGVLLDSARHYQSPEFIRQLLDAMALSKLDVLHWHLTDDQGWRLEIRKYPRLTSVGAWRVSAATPPATGERVGGFYAQAEVRGLVAYAEARGITIVPEIEMPGHATAAIRAYPWLGVGAPPPPGAESDWGVFPYLFDPGDRGISFLGDVLGEVMALFPSRYIHIGGDEALKDRWRASPAVQAQMHRLGVTGEDQLQAWLTARIARFLAAHGRRLIGWDEILDGPVPADAAVMSWHGVDGAVRAAAAGHDAVLAASPTLYLDHRQGNGDHEPPGRLPAVTLADVYAFDPGLSPHTLGLQANLWTEHVRTEAQAGAALFPRALAVADLGWSAAADHDPVRFEAAIPAQLDRLRAIGLSVSDDPPRLAHPEAADAPRAVDGLTLCSAKLPLALEDDAPADTGRANAARAVFVVDIMNPCWRYPAVLDGVRSIAIDVGQRPFNFQLGADRASLRFQPPATAAGELVVRSDDCTGTPIAVLPLATAAARAGVTTLRAPLPALAGRHDLCLSFTARGPDPLWAVTAVRLGPR